MRSNHFHILIVEDNRADADLARILFSSVAPQINLHFCEDGVEASHFLFRREKYAMSTITPDIIILDLNIPRRDGRSLLKEIKSHPNLCMIPVVIFSTSNSDREVSDSYCLGASAFITKPVDISDFTELLKTLVDFYFVRARLATKPGKVS